MKRIALRAYLATAAVGVAGPLLLPADGLPTVLWKVAVGYLAVAAVALGVRIHRPRSRAPWVFFALGVFGNATGMLVEHIIYSADPNAVMPTAADALYLSLYPALAIGLGILIRHRESARNVAALIDTVTITTGLGLLAWVYLIRPAGADLTLTLSGRIANVAYPVADVVLLAMVVRLLFGARSRSMAFAGLAGAIGLFLFGDLAWAVVNIAGWVVAGPPYYLLSSVFQVAYLAIGCAALHGSMAELGERDLHAPTALSRRRLALLGLATLLAPGLLAFQVARGQVTDGAAIALGSVALFLLVVVRMAQLLHSLEQQSARLRELTRIDELTALPNRRAWSAELPLALERARRAAYPLCVAMIDLDHFKRFNDEFGHPAGDRLLRSAAAAWRQELREGDVLARYGGEEFIVLLPSADDRDGREILERLRRATPLGQSFSAGLARWDGVETSDELLARADQALYRAKAAGRDRVEFDGEPTPVGAPSPLPA